MIPIKRMKTDTLKQIFIRKDSLSYQVIEYVSKTVIISYNNLFYYLLNNPNFKLKHRTNSIINENGKEYSAEEIVNRYIALLVKKRILIVEKNEFGGNEYSVNYGQIVNNN